MTTAELLLTRSEFHSTNAPGTREICVPWRADNLWQAWTNSWTECSTGDAELKTMLRHTDFECTNLADTSVVFITYESLKRISSDATGSRNELTASSQNPYAPPATGVPPTAVDERPPFAKRIAQAVGNSIIFMWVGTLLVAPVLAFVDTILGGVLKNIFHEVLLTTGVILWIFGAVDGLHRADRCGAESKAGHSL